LAVYELIVDSSQAEHVALKAEPGFLSVPDFKDLRGHKARSAAPDENISRFVDVSGQSEVYDFDGLAVIRNDNILRFEIPVNNFKSC
jgi:hypothetical protein